MYVLLAEDDVRLGKLMVHMLKKERHSVDWVRDGREAVQYSEISEYDCIILDWLLPSLSGPDVCRKLRQRGFQRGILMLTAKDSLTDRIHGLDEGADDYMTKPFEFQELFARMRALERRMDKQLVKEDLLQTGVLTLNLLHHTVEANGKEVPLTVKEYQLLELFMRNPSQVLPRDLIEQRIWGVDAEVSSNNVDALMKLLRKKLEGHCRIRSVRGVGYKLEASAL
ncbi:response regulator transcription factor [Ectobacillus ponti]|uniref:Response regulator transcription factor n=1 Tax=Ectobacillus ponti TaxID=2961894 RepID=A0AA41X9D5_9BACI|nr:response regulator transcription factor [Ectobacillus ponti]MCP8971301.1 response regulator transcription factor [Ectobacillus ponti]